MSPNWWSAGSDAIEKELEQTYENVLAKKLATPEGMALIKAKIAEIEGAPADSTAARPRRKLNTPAAPLPASGDVHHGPVGNRSGPAVIRGADSPAAAGTFREPSENRRT